MRLKQVKLNNFKSYQGKSVVDIENSKILFVGRNGSGKSNFFQAIDFILGHRNAVLRQADRFRFFNDGRNDANLYVEIVLEDPDNFFGEDLRIRRALTLQRDAYYVNGCKVTRKHLTVLLEVLGCPLPKPFYFVSLSMMKTFLTPDSKSRFKVLTTSLGLGVSNTLRYLDEAMHIFGEMQVKLNDLNQLMKNVKPDQIDLLEQKYKEYEALKKERATILVLLHSRLIEKWKSMIARENDRLEGKNHSAQNCSREVHHLKCAITSTKIAIQEAEHELAASKILMDDLENERVDLLRNKEKLTLKIMDTEKSFNSEEENMRVEGVEESEEGTSSSSNITLMERRMEEIAGRFQRNYLEIEALTKQLNKKNLARDNLVLKLGVFSKFSSEEMKKWIEEEVNKLNDKLKLNLNDIATHELKKSEAENVVSQCKAELEKIHKEEEKLPLMKANESSAKLRFNELHGELNELNRQEKLYLNGIPPLIKNIRSKQAELKFKIGGAVFNGYESVNKIRTLWNSSEDDQNRRFNLGCYGTVIDNIKCDSAFYCAIDTAVGNRLFMQVVESDAIGTAILHEMKMLNYSGEVSFLPLNRVRAAVVPVINTDEAQPLITVLDYPSSIHNVMLFLFGAVVLCRNLEVATQIAKSSGCTCVTLEGDRVQAHGSISGGFSDASSTVPSLYYAYKLVLALRNDLSADLKKTKALIDDKKALIDSTVAKLHQAKIQTLVEDLKGAKTELKQQIFYFENEAKHYNNQIRLKQEDNVLINERKRALENIEEKGDISSSLGAQSVKHLNEEIFELTKKCNERSVALSKLKSQMSIIEHKVACSREVSLGKTDRIVKSHILRRKLEDYKIKDKQLSSHLVLVERKISAAESTHNENLLKVEELSKRLAQLKQNLAETEVKSGGLNISITRDKIAAYERKVSEDLKLVQAVSAVYKIKNLEVHRTRTEDEIFNDLRRLNAAIKNKKSITQISKRALKRKIKFRRIQQGLKNLENDLSVLCVLFSLLQSWIGSHVDVSLDLMSKWASHYFKLMVPNGSLAVVLERRPSMVEAEALINGVSFEVQFPDESKIMEMTVLSGGQQVAVFTSLVLGLLKILQIEFCIMDEIDQSLTSTNLYGLLNVISEFPNHQFLISSHNKDVVSRGDAHFAVSFMKSSKIRSVQKSEALQILQSLGNESRRPSTSLMSSSISQLSTSFQHLSSPLAE